MRHGDFALTQHVQAFQTTSLIGKDYKGISDAHNMVVVVAKMYGEEKHSGASEPTGPIGPPDAAEPAPTGPASTRDVPELEEEHSGASEPTGPSGPPVAAEPAPTDPASARDAPGLTEAADKAAQSLADMLEDQPKYADRRPAPAGFLYSKEEFLDYYGDDGHDRWEEADQIDEYQWEPNGLSSILGRVLWPRETPRVMMVVDGEILVAATTCPPKAVIRGLFKTLLRVRQAEFAAQAGVNDPNAGDTGAAEPGGPIDDGRVLSDEEFGSAYGRWRHQWLQRITLTPWQEEERRTLAHAQFCKKARSWFEAWLNNYLGNRFVARAVIRYGCANVALLTTLVTAIDAEKQAEAKKRKLHVETHGAGEPVWQLRLNAHHARQALRDGRRLARKVAAGHLTWECLSGCGQDLMQDYNARRLHVRVDEANAAYGHGIAQTHDFGFRPGQNMCRDLPIEVRAVLRTLQGSCEPVG